MDIEDELPALLGTRRMDMVNPRCLNPRLNPRIPASAEVQYAEDDSVYLGRRSP